MSESPLKLLRGLKVPEEEIKAGPDIGETLADLHAKVQNLPPIKWAVPSLIGEGLTLLAGPSKFGKTYMSLDISFAVATGNKALGQAICEQGDVLYLAAESSDRTVTEAVHDIAPPEMWGEARLRIKTATTFSGSDDTGRLVGQWFDSVPAPRLLILDSLERVLPKPTARTQTSYDYDVERLKGMHKWSLDNHVAVVLIHHTNQRTLNEGEDWANSVQGSTGLLSVVDSIIKVGWSKDKDGWSPPGKLMVRSRDLPEAEYGLNRSGRFWMISDPMYRAEWAGDLTPKIMACLTEAPQTALEAAGRLGLARSTVTLYLKEMEARGLVEASGTPKRFSPSELRQG